MNSIGTIIIGGGVSGMACGKTLYENNHDFLMLTKDIGGRMLTSKSNKVNYGASYITSDYENIIPYMGGREKINISDCYFHDEHRPVSFYQWRTLLELPRLFKLFLIARDFRKRLRLLRKRALYEQQKDILESDPVLNGYVKKTALDFVKENNLEYLNERYFASLFNSTGFIEYDRCNTFAYLDNLMALFCTTYYADHSHCCHQLTEGWKNKIELCKVNMLQANASSNFLIRTSDKEYKAENIVLALPYNDAMEFYNVPEPDHNIPIHVLEVQGVRNEFCKNKKVVFFHAEHHEITILWRQITGTDVIFSKVPQPDLDRYYSNYQILNSIYWETAVVLSGNKWCDQKLDKGLYLASDYNICGLEDAYITGVYAANQIILTSSV
jgi:hypothetical protein